MPRNGSWRTGSVAAAVLVVAVASPAAAAPLLPLEVTDPVYEDIVVPEVFGPTGDALAPEIDGLQPEARSSGILPTLGALWGIGTTHEVSGVPPLTAVTELVPRDVVPGDALPGPSIYLSASLWDGEYAGQADGYLVPDVPLLVDLSGDALPDLMVEVRWATGSPQVRVTRLPTAPSHFPAAVSVSVEFDDRPWDAEKNRLFVSHVDGAFPQLVTLPLDP